MSRLPTPGGDDGQWGGLLNDYLLLEHNPDGSHRVGVNPDASTTTKGKIQLAGDLTGTAAAPQIAAGAVTGSKIATGTVAEANLDTAAQAKLNAVGGGGAVSSVNTRTGAIVLTKTDVALANVDNTSDASKPVSALTQTALNAKYALPASGIPNTDLAAAVQASLTTADARDATKLQGTTVDASAPTNGQVLVYSTGTSSWVPNTATSTVVSDATTGAKGIVQLAGDLGGTASSPTVPGLVAKLDKSVAVAKGDVLVATGAATVSRVAVGTNAQVLTADSTQASGVKWATPVAGGGGGLSYTFSTKTANYTASTGDYIFADPTTSGITITLPAPAANATVRVKRLVPAGNSVQVAAPVGSFIDAAGVGTDTINSQYQGQDYLSDGSNWFRV